MAPPVAVSGSDLPNPPTQRKEKNAAPGQSTPPHQPLSPRVQLPAPRLELSSPRLKLSNPRLELSIHGWNSWPFGSSSSPLGWNSPIHGWNSWPLGSSSSILWSSGPARS